MSLGVVDYMTQSIRDFIYFFIFLPSPEKLLLSKASGIAIAILDLLEKPCYTLLHISFKLFPLV